MGKQQAHPFYFSLALFPFNTLICGFFRFYGTTGSDVTDRSSSIVGMTASIKLSVPGLWVQMPTTVNPTLCSRSVQSFSVRSLDDMSAIISQSSPVVAG